MKLKKQFSDFYDEIKIGKESEKLKDKREILEKDIKDKFPNEMHNHNIELKRSDIEIFDQGSYKYHTTIKSTIIDRDVAVKIPLNIDEYNDPRKIKIYLYDALNKVEARTVKIKEPCVNVTYYENNEEWMHIDLPIYAEHNGNIYLARGTRYGTPLWEIADPKGLNEDLCDKINGNEQLRRIIRFIKKWKNEKYANSCLDHEVPPSIGLTYLACDCFESVSNSDGDDDLLALKNTMAKILNKFVLNYESSELVKATITKILPVQPYSDIFKKMNESSDSYGVTFYKRLKEAVDNLMNAINVENDHDAGNYVQKVLGDEFVVPEKEATSAITQDKREHSFG